MLKLRSQIFLLTSHTWDLISRPIHFSDLRSNLTSRFSDLNNNNTMTYKCGHFNMVTYTTRLLAVSRKALYCVCVCVCVCVWCSLRAGRHICYVSSSESLALCGLIDASECKPTYGAGNLLTYLLTYLFTYSTSTSAFRESPSWVTWSLQPDTHFVSYVR